MVEKKKTTPDISGQRYGSKIVLAFIGYNKARAALWKVRCDCGAESVKSTGTLQRLCSPSCPKCNPSLKLPRPSLRLRPFEAQYRGWVSFARHPVEISYEAFLILTQVKECHYCDAPIIWREVTNNKLSGNHASNLDRKDNTGPYSIENVVVCCRRCNVAKGDRFTYEEWKEIGMVIKSWRTRQHVDRQTANASGDYSAPLYAPIGQAEFGGDCFVSSRADGLVQSSSTAKNREGAQITGASRN